MPGEVVPTNFVLGLRRNAGSPRILRTSILLATFLNVTPTNPTNANYPINYIALLQVRTRWPSPQLTSTNVSVISLFNYQ